MLKNQTVLITGASSGIGKEFAHVFAREGFHVVLVARSISVLEDLANELSEKYAINAIAISCDFSLPHAASQLLTELNTKNLSIDILINNAGYGINDFFEQMSIDEILGMLAVNITALTELTYLLLPMLRKNKNSKILNVASTAAFQAGPRMAVYCASKAYVLSFSEALAAELKNTGISVTVLCPGATITKFSERARMENKRLFKRNFAIMQADVVARQGYEALMKAKRVVICGKLNKLLAFSTRLSPRFLTTAIAAFLMK